MYVGLVIAMMLSKSLVRGPIGEALVQSLVCKTCSSKITAMIPDQIVGYRFSGKSDTGSVSWL